MKLATNNAFFNSTQLIINGQTGAISQRLTNTDFSQKVSASSGTLSITVPAVGPFSEYVAIHGLYTPNFGSYRVRVLSDGVEVFNEVTQKNSIMATRSSSSTPWIIEVSEFSGEVSASYVAAGFATDVPNGGVRGGQLLPYHGLNIKTAFRINQLAQPTSVIYENTAPRVAFTIPDSMVDWITGDLQLMLSLYRQIGVVSILDFDDDPTSCIAAFDMSCSIKSHPSTRALQAAQLQYSVAQ